MSGKPLLGSCAKKKEVEKIRIIQSHMSAKDASFPCGEIVEMDEA